MMKRAFGLAVATVSVLIGCTTDATVGTDQDPEVTDTAVDPVDTAVDPVDTLVEADSAPLADTTAPLDTDIASDGGAEAGTLDESCMKVAEARCALYKRCQPYKFAAQWKTEAECAARDKIFCEKWATAPTASFTSAEVLSCASSLATQACSDFRDYMLPGTCGKKGTAPTDAVCFHSTQCKSGNCLTDRNFENTWNISACSKCTLVPAPGDDCSSSSLTAPNGYHCDWEGTRKIVRNLAAGAACRRDTDCRGGLNCVLNKCVAKLTTAGAACSTSDITGAKGTPFCDDAFGYKCVSGSCEKLAHVAAGSPCVSNGAACIAGTFCKTGSPTSCQPLNADGSSCTNGSISQCTWPAACPLGTSQACKILSATTCSAM